MDIMESTHSDILFENKECFIKTTFQSKEHMKNIRIYDTEDMLIMKNTVMSQCGSV